LCHVICLFSRIFPNFFSFIIYGAQSWRSDLGLLFCLFLANRGSFFWLFTMLMMMGDLVGSLNLFLSYSLFFFLRACS
jgi:hypothetical protein